MFHKLHSALCDSCRCVFGPSDLLRLLQYRATVLDDEFEVGVQTAHLYVETTQSSAYVDDGGGT